MTRLALALVLLLAGCPKTRNGEARRDEPVAEPAPVEIDWPDAAPADAP